jgi:predicted phage baseplate assembly protein
MPIHPPALDDRGFDDLVGEALSRIPAHTPEWTNPREGDPGRTLIELFAWLTDTLLYRANLIPEKQRLAFLRLLGEQMRPATAARGVVSLAFDDEDNIRAAVTLRPMAALPGPVAFETRAEVTVLPITAEAYYKRPLAPASPVEQRRLAEVVRGLTAIYELPGRVVTPYVTTPVFAGGAAEPEGFDVVARTVDRTLWLALLAPDPKHVEAVRTTLGARAEGRPALLSIGVSPAVAVPALADDVGPRPPVPHVWEIAMQSRAGALEYHALDRVADSSDGLTRRGVLRLALPASSSERSLRAPDNDVRRDFRAGVGDSPPRLDVPEKAERLVTWIRLRPTVRLASLSLAWVDVNAVDIDQRQTIVNRVLGQSDGSADQEMALPARGVEPESLEVQVDETGYGYRTWTPIDDLALAGRDDAVYSLDGEAGTIRFGDGMRGRIPEAGRRVRAATLRAGGGKAGNLPAGTLKAIKALDLRGAAVSRLKARQSLPTVGGDEAETLAEAERRIPGLLRHRDRAVTEDDYRTLTAYTPGVRVGRVEVLPRFKPQQRRSDVPGVVTVLVLPHKEGTTAPAPRADRPFLEAVHRHLDERRPLSTELYVIGCEYIPLGVGVGVTVRDGFAQDAAANAVRDALRAILWPLPPGGAGTGWQLGRTVSDRELEVAVARVPDVSAVAGVRLFERKGGAWSAITAVDRSGATMLPLRLWQLPELLTVVVTTDGTIPADLRGAPNPFLASSNGHPDGAVQEVDVAVPVVPEVC